jgi:hypothetical protein
MPKKKAYSLPLPCCAFDGVFMGGFGSAKWAHVVRNESYNVKVGHYIGPNSPATPPGGSKLI